MSPLTGIITVPTLQGTVAVSGPWQSLFARANHRVYPMKLGCGVRDLISGSTIDTFGLGEFAQNDYILVCTRTNYGNSFLYVPDTDKITRVTSDPTAASDDELVVSPTLTVAVGDWLLNLGADGATAPLTAPDFDGGNTLYIDAVAASTNANPYLVTGQGGHFRGWVADGVNQVDLLVNDSSGVPLIAMPGFDTGRSLVT